MATQGHADWPLNPLRPVLGKLDQGLVFTCARADDYDFCPVFGVTITARCDIAQLKVPVFSYLPIVDLRSWWQVDGVATLSARARKQQESAFRDVLRQSGHSASILDVQSPQAISETLFGVDATGSAAKNRARVASLTASLNRIQGWETSPQSVESVSRACQEFGGLKRSIMEELVSQRLAGCYFLPQIEYGGQDIGFVVCLRQVRHLPRLVAQQVAEGLTYDANVAANAEVMANLSFRHGDFAMAIGQLPSPLIEHVMQMFSLLYTRIGLADFSATYLATLWDRQGFHEKPEA